MIRSHIWELCSFPVHSLLLCTFQIIFDLSVQINCAISECFLFQFSIKKKSCASCLCLTVWFGIYWATVSVIYKVANDNRGGCLHHGLSLVGHMKGLSWWSAGEATTSGAVRSAWLMCGLTGISWFDQLIFFEKWYTDLHDFAEFCYYTCSNYSISVAFVWFFFYFLNFFNF